ILIRSEKRLREHEQFIHPHLAIHSPLPRNPGLVWLTALLQLMLDFDRLIVDDFQPDIKTMT
ncbi:unnamed protein product, partial [Hymenolepis diminuta]